MSGRPWLEALKRVEEASRVSDREPEGGSNAPGEAPTRPPERSRYGPGKARNVGYSSAARSGESLAIREGERRLLAAGWTPKRRCGLVIWKNPDTGFYFSQEVALHRLGRSGGEGPS